MTSPALDIRDVWLSFRGVPVLEEINLTLDEGEYLGIIGPNGSGKTTLLKVILGLLPVDRGVVRIFGQPPARARGLVGYVPQHARFDADFPISVLDTVLMGRLAVRKQFHRFNAEDYNIARTMLSRVEMLDLADRQLGKLSGGQLQRVLIARALTSQPRLLLLDEPAASLDIHMGRGVYDLLTELSKEEMTIALVSHDIGVIARQVKSVACLNRRLYYHHAKELTPEMLEAVYGCPVDLLAHGIPHRVFESQRDGGGA